jgi:adenosine deaminase
MPADVPLRTLLEAGVPVALGADDPLLFGHRLTAQYELARQAHGLPDAALAELARMSVRGSVAPAATRARLLAGIDAWLAAPDPASQPGSPAGSAAGDAPADDAPAGDAPAGGAPVIADPVGAARGPGRHFS